MTFVSLFMGNLSFSCHYVFVKTIIAICSSVWRLENFPSNYCLYSIQKAFHFHVAYTHSHICKGSLSRYEALFTSPVPACLSHWWGTILHSVLTLVKMTRGIIVKGNKYKDIPKIITCFVLNMFFLAFIIDSWKLKKSLETRNHSLLGIIFKWNK